MATSQSVLHIISTIVVVVHFLYSFEDNPFVYQSTWRNLYVLEHRLG